MSDVQAAIAAICAQALSRSEVPPEANLTLLGVDSMTAVEIVTQIELRYGVDVVETYFATPTVAALTAAVQRETDQTPAR